MVSSLHDYNRNPVGIFSSPLRATHSVHHIVFDLVTMIVSACRSLVGIVGSNPAGSMDSCM